MRMVTKSIKKQRKAQRIVFCSRNRIQVSIWLEDFWLKGLERGHGAMDSDQFREHKSGSTQRATNLKTVQAQVLEPQPGRRVTNALPSQRITIANLPGGDDSIKFLSQSKEKSLFNF